MQLLHESTVQAEEIDSLGHMNVRFYMARMEAANQALLDDIGLPQDALHGAYLRRIDTYTRFRQEQFEGAPLHAVGGVLTLGEAGMQSYVEIRNPETDTTAATFIVTTALVDRTDRQPRLLPVLKHDDVQQVEIPNYARPRSLELGPVNTDVTLEELERVVPDVEGGGMMSGRRHTQIDDGDVDAEGWLREDLELMFLPFTKMAAETGTPHGPPVFNTSDGRRVGWAVMETRNMLFGQPRLGDEIAYFSADVGVEKKSRLSRRWALDRNSGKLLGISDTVGLCIDLDARRATSWPDELREQIERHVLPQLA